MVCLGRLTMILKVRRSILFLDNLPFLIFSTKYDTYFTSQEAVMFPFLQQKLDFSGEIELHKVIHAGLERSYFPYIPSSSKADIFHVQCISN